MEKLTKYKYTLPRQFLEDLFNEEMDNVRSALSEVRESDPKGYLRLMVDIGKIIIPKEGNLRHDIYNHDLDELTALGKIKDKPGLNHIEGQYVDDIQFICEEPPLLSHPQITDTPEDIAAAIHDAPE